MNLSTNGENMNKEMVKWLSLTIDNFEPDGQLIPYMIGHSRERKYFRIRAVAMYLMKKHIEDITLKEIGVAFAGQSHSTVIDAIKAVENNYMGRVRKIEAAGKQAELALDIK